MNQPPSKPTFVRAPRPAHAVSSAHPSASGATTVRLNKRMAELGLCSRREADALKYVREHIGELVIKEVNGSGGYGMLVGPHATRAEIVEFEKKLVAQPDNYIAQPTLSLSTCPAFVEEGVAPRHVDLRPI